MEYKLDKITHIEDDIEKIQTKPGMYMSYLGNRGARHLAFEVINNAFDECLNKSSPADTVTITYDIDSDVMTVTDNGRGLPPESMKVACTKINAGSKITRESSGASAGENGVGLTCVNAMSRYFKMIVKAINEDKVYTLEFNEGKEVSDTARKNAGNTHGTTIEFAPSQQYLGKNTKIPYKEVLEWVEKLSYLFSEKLKVKFEVWKGGKLKEEHKIKTQPFSKYLASFVDKPLTPIISMEDSETFMEEVRDKKQKKSARLAFCFCYGPTLPEFNDSFCNLINTIDNGDHLDAIKEALNRYLSMTTKKALTDREASKYDITWADVQSGLNIAVNLDTNMQNLGFTGQTKQKIKSEQVYDLVKTMATRTIQKYFDEHPEALNQLIKVIKLNAKARVEMNKIKSSVIKETTTFWDEHKMQCFVPCNNRTKSQHKELFLVEGKSAKGAAQLARDPDTQALFAFRGVSANAFKRDGTTILDNEEFKNLTKVLGCNIGPKFDINKLKYDMIIVLTDADQPAIRSAVTVM